MHAIYLLIGLAIPSPAPADSTGVTASGAFFALSVPDLAASVQWYSAKLGLKVVMAPPKMEHVAVTVLEGGGLIVELVQNDKAVPLATAAPGVKEVHGLLKAGVIVDDLGATLAMLKSRGVEIAYGPFPPQRGQRPNVIIRDNAGNLIQFFGK